MKCQFTLYTYYSRLNSSVCSPNIIISIPCMFISFHVPYFTIQTKLAQHNTKFEFETLPEGLEIILKDYSCEHHDDKGGGLKQGQAKNVCLRKSGWPKKMSTRQAGNPFFSLIFRLHIQTKFSKERKK